MKKIIVYIFFAAMLTVGAVGVQAQERLQFKVGYNTGMPIGAFKDFM